MEDCLSASLWPGTFDADSRQYPDVTASVQIGAAVRVETPFPLWAVPRVWTWMRAVWPKVADDFGPADFDAFLEKWAAGEEIEERWAVYRGEDLGGLITVQRLTPYLATTHIVFSKAFLGYSTTLEAMRQVYQQTFDSGVGKLCVQVFADNSNLIALAKRTGAVVEGRLRAHTLQGGEPRDMVILGLLREEFETCQSAQQH
jgi:RimJ/RimL family protein N-acetyltransferase